MTVHIHTVFDKSLMIRMPRSNEAMNNIKEIMKKEHDEVEIKAGNRSLHFHSCDIMFIDVEL